MHPPYGEISVDGNTATRTKTLKWGWEGTKASQEPKENDQKPRETPRNSGTLPQPEGDLCQSLLKTPA